MNALDVATQDRLRELAEEAGRPRRRAGRGPVRRREGVRGGSGHQGDAGHGPRGHGRAGRRAPGRPSPPWPASPSPSWRPSPATRSAAAASWRSAPTSGSPATTPSWASPRSCSASSPARAAPSAWPVWSAPPRPRTSSSPGGRSRRTRRWPSGWSTRWCPAAEVYEQAHAWAARLAKGPAIALRAAKEAIDAGLETDLGTGLAVERTWFAALFATEDRERGMRSFVEDGPGQGEVPLNVRGTGGAGRRQRDAVHVRAACTPVGGLVQP